MKHNASVGHDPHRRRQDVSEDEESDHESDHVNARSYVHGTANANVRLDTPNESRYHGGHVVDDHLDVANASASVHGCAYELDMPGACDHAND